jgi:precorrin-6A/cobalt-precorrin-6A reductase
LPDYHSIVSRGPFTVEDDIALLRNHAIEMLVSKNSGGSGAISKIEAARALSLPVIMINRPPLLRERQEVESVKEAMEWLLHGTKDRGV